MSVALLYRDYWQPGQTLPNFSPDLPDKLSTSSHQQWTDQNSIVIDIFQSFQASIEKQLTEVCSKLGNIHERMDNLEQQQKSLEDEIK